MLRSHLRSVKGYRFNTSVELRKLLRFVGSTVQIVSVAVLARYNNMVGSRVHEYILYIILRRTQEIQIVRFQKFQEHIVHLRLLGNFNLFSVTSTFDVPSEDGSIRRCKYEDIVINDHLPKIHQKVELIHHNYTLHIILCARDLLSRELSVPSDQSRRRNENMGGSCHEY